MAYIVTNKWFQARYGEPLRRLFTNKAVFEEIIDFGHAPIFEDADTFPCIVVCHHRGEDDSKTKVRICRVPRDRNTELSLEQFVGENSYAVPWSLYGAEAWSLEPPEVNDLMEKMLSEGLNLRDYSAVKPYFGVKTGFNEAFLIDDATRMKLVNKDPKSQEILKPYLRGRDIKRWVPQWKNLWMIFTRRGIDINAYPAVKEHLEKYRTQLEPCPADWEKDKDGEWPGRKKGKYKWYELQDPVDYWELFESEKIVYQDIGYHSRFALSAAREFAEATTFSIPSSDKWLLAVLCSPLMWWYLWRNTVHGKDEALRLKKIYIEKIPIPKPQDTVRDEAEDAVTELITLTLQNSIKQQELLDWLLYTYSIEKPGQKLEAYTDLTIDEFIAEVRKRKPKQTSKLKPSDIKALKEALVEYAEPARANLARITKLERRLSDLVNQAYSLTDDEVALMWKTAPPRMPLVGVQDK
ncbi:MAG: TaqI-like C-terminal specificity domain-containing protein [Marinoscillum sp.]